MDLKIYAISQKLKNQNSELLKYIKNDNIPRDVIETEFKEIFEKYQDDEAMLLADDYKEYLLGTTQVMFSKNASGLDIEGEVKDNVLDVIETVHKASKEQVVGELVSGLVETINPTREYEITNIDFIEQLSSLEDRIQKHKSQIDEIKLNKSIEEKVDELEKSVEVEDKKSVNEQIESFNKAVEDVRGSSEVINNNIESKYKVEEKIELPEVEELPTPEVISIEEKSEKKEVDPSTQDMIKEYVNEFFSQVKAKKIDERIPLTNNVSYAL